MTTADAIYFSFGGRFRCLLVMAGIISADYLQRYYPRRNAKSRRRATAFYEAAYAGDFADIRAMLSNLVNISLRRAELHIYNIIFLFFR